MGLEDLEEPASIFVLVLLSGLLGGCVCSGFLPSCAKSL